MVPKAMQQLRQPWHACTFVAFDTETSGAYPLGADIVEFGAVKWCGGRVVEEYQTLLKPKHPMTPFNMSIHGITNEMVEDAPIMKQKISEIKEFLGDSVLVAHHAPFDLGFVAVDFERSKLPFPGGPVLCSSLLSRKLIPQSHNHKLQTLIKFLQIDGGQAHRANDDAKACLQVALECFRRAGDEATIADLIEMQGKDLRWNAFQVLDQSDMNLVKIVEAIEDKRPLDIAYEGGSKGEEFRRISPLGIVRNPDGDYVMALCHKDATHKRFYIGKMKDIAVAYD
ncbi:MAG: WYL domain-containing protein [Proteobacteria bacterium]|jgi:DNA polymerase-3 subunit epsilon|nr:WYL domain-containing protein [Pseudomonadota bacterium]